MQSRIPFFQARFSRLTAMAECPKCKKKFRSIFHVSRHLSQPWSDCAREYAGLVTAQLPSTFIPPESGMDLEQTEEETSIQEQEAHPFEELNPDFDFEPMFVDPEHLAHDVQVPLRFREDHPTAAQCYEGSQTFMTQFDQDEYSAHRKDNLYYPFASFQEWQLGYFLFSSGISMKLINEFLRLDMVSLYSTKEPGRPDGIFRSGGWRSPLRRPKC